MTDHRGRCVDCKRIVAVFGGDYAVAHHDPITNSPCPGYGKQVTELVDAPPKPAPVTPPGPDFLAVREIAHMLRVAPMTIYRLIDAGELRAIRIGRSYRVHRAALDAYMAGAEVVVEQETA